MLHDARVANLLAMDKATPDSPEVILNLAQAFNARSMPRRAREAAARLLALDAEHPCGWFEAVMARSFGEREELEEICGELEALIKAHPDEAWPQRNLGLALYHLERDDEARKACSAALDIDSRDSRSHEVLAYLAFTVGDLDTAIEETSMAVELDPQNFRALHWLGECHLKRGDLDEAAGQFHRSLRVEDSFFLALESLGALYLSEEATFPAAWQCFSRILSVNPRYFPAYFRLADAFIQAERFVEAAAQVEAVLHLEPDSTAEADAHQYLGLLALMEQDLEDARPHFEHALEIDPDFPAAHHYLGVVAERSGDLDAAETSFKRAIECDPDYPNPRVRLGYVCFDRKEYENARRHFNKALEIDPEEYLAHLGLGELARWRHQYEEQLEHCMRAVAIAPEDSNVQNQLGTAHDALAHFDEAVTAYDEALTLDPHNRQAANNLGYLHERRLESCPEDAAAGVTEKAVAAWKRRLLICRDSELSLDGACEHLQSLGVSDEDIRDWLEHGQIN